MYQFTTQTQLQNLATQEAQEIALLKTGGFLTTNQVARLLGISPSSLEKARSTSRGTYAALPYLKLGRSVRYTREALNSFLSNAQIVGTRGSAGLGVHHGEPRANLRAYINAQGNSEIIERFVPNAQRDGEYYRIGDLYGSAGQSAFAKRSSWHVKDAATDESCSVVELVQRAQGLEDKEQALDLIESSISALKAKQASSSKDKSSASGKKRRETCIVPPAEIFERDIGKFKIGDTDKTGKTLDSIHIYRMADRSPVCLKLRHEFFNNAGFRKKTFVLVTWHGPEAKMKYKGMGWANEPPYNLPAIVTDKDRIILGRVDGFDQDECCSQFHD